MREAEARLSTRLYLKRGVQLVRGEGARVWDSEGREYIDCVSGHGVANLGHAVPEVTAAIAEQAQRLVSCPELFYNDRRGELLALLDAITPPHLTRFFLCNSGTEAVEAAIKFARLATGRLDVLAFMQSFHGKTQGALSLTWTPEYRKPFEPLLLHARFAPFNKPQALAEALTDQTAAAIVEVVQGEGGVRPATTEFLQALQAGCRDRGALLIVDEVQTGFGRTGRLFASEHAGLEPDLVCLAKSLAGGLPMGAVALTEAIDAKLFPRAHSSTFGGNPLACAAAVAAIRYLLDRQLPARAAELGERFLTALRGLKSPLIREVRGLGLLAAIELKARSRDYLEALMEEGVLALAAGPTVIRYLPPLVIEPAQLDLVVEKTAKVLGQPSRA
ncbi:MAG: aspartate aminotransferase family protein [Deltaproteobacteria bacterium]|nr:aspartate aminotransferase family protein [Deltaproteobacteria bacterium]